MNSATPPSPEAPRALHDWLYTLDTASFFAPSLRAALEEGTEDALRSILTQHGPGLFSFDMLTPELCTAMLEEVEHFKRWALTAGVTVMRPNTMNSYGVVLDDIGMDDMLSDLMADAVAPLASSVLFGSVGGSTLDSHHGFVVDYALHRDVELGFHVDDSEVTLNVCLGRSFEGGELFFRGIRCDRHVNGEAQEEECVEYAHAPGRAILHAGRHRHGAKRISAGNRVNLILWCRSSEAREQRKYQRDFSAWCAECRISKQGRQQLAPSAVIAA
eukprot:SM000065S20180  [mRNA]  locus=s65:95728:97569:- [translate_table: standard]